MRSRTNRTINTQVDSMILPKIIVDIIVIGHFVRGAVLSDDLDHQRLGKK